MVITRPFLRVVCSEVATRFGFTASMFTCVEKSTFALRVGQELYNVFVGGDICVYENYEYNQSLQKQTTRYLFSCQFLYLQAYLVFFKDFIMGP